MQQHTPPIRRVIRCGVLGVKNHSMLHGRYIIPPVSDRWFLTSLPKQMINSIIGIILIVLGFILMLPFLRQFLLFVAGLILLVIGIQFLWRR